MAKSVPDSRTPRRLAQAIRTIANRFPRPGAGCKRRGAEWLPAPRPPSCFAPQLPRAFDRIVLNVCRDRLRQASRRRALDIDEVVTGDLLVAGPGDQFLADGELLDGRPQVIEGVSTGDQGRGKFKEEGDLIQAGSYCLGGRAIFQVTALPLCLVSVILH